MAVKIKTGKYKIYHIPGQKVGCTTDIEKRVIKEQGFKRSEFEIIFETNDIKEAAEAERTLQKDLGYKVDIKPYDKLFVSADGVKVNVTDQTTTFPIPYNEINASHIADLQWETQYGKVTIDASDKIDWILDNIKKSMFSKDRSYIYNKALYEAGPFQKHMDRITFKDIRQWAETRGITTNGDSKTQYVKLMEEAGELAEALLKKDKKEIKDAIGDMIVVLTNLSSLEGFKIEDCIDHAYNEIVNRTGKMINGTFVKDE